MYMAQQISHIPNANQKTLLIYNVKTNSKQDTKKIFCKIQKAAKSLNCQVPGVLACLDYAGSRHRQITHERPHHHWVLFIQQEANTDKLIPAIQIAMGAKDKDFKPHDETMEVIDLVDYNCKYSALTQNHTQPVYPEIYPSQIISSKDHRFKKCTIRAQKYYEMIKSETLLGGIGNVFTGNI